MTEVLHVQQAADLYRNSQGAAGVPSAAAAAPAVKKPRLGGVSLHLASKYPARCGWLVGQLSRLRSFRGCLRI